MEGLLIFFSGLVLGGFYTAFAWHKLRKHNREIKRQRQLLRTRTMRGGKLTYLN
jgi:site-specific recombinase